MSGVKETYLSREYFPWSSTAAPIGVATHSLHDTVPEEMKSLLPSPDKIAEIVGVLGQDWLS